MTKRETRILALGIVLGGLMVILGLGVGMVVWGIP
jgi:hypothetical protein